MSDAVSTGRDRVASLFSVAGKTALVTGGGRGIGYMISRGLIQAGVKVYISSRKGDVMRRRPRSCRRCRAAPAASPSGRPVPGRRVRPPRRRADGPRADARHPREQRRRQLGRGLRDLPRRRLGPGARHQRQGRLPPDPGAHARAGRGGVAGRSGPRRSTSARSTACTCPGSRRTRTRRARPPCTTSPGCSPSKLAPRHITVNAIAPGPFESKMMAATLESSATRSAGPCPSAASASPTTWPASPSS